MDELRYYPTKGGLVVGKSKRAEHLNLEKMPDYRPEEDLDFLPILQPKQTSGKGIQDDSSSVGSQASTVVDPLQSDADFFDLLDDEYIFESTYTSGGTINEAVIPDEDQDSEDEDPPQEPEINDDEEINITGQIQATLASTLEFKEFVENTQNIGGDHELSENQEFVEKLFIGQQWLSKVQCRDYLKDLALDMNYCMVQKKNKEKIQSYKCKDETCEWFVYCSRLSDGQTFECKKGNFIHTCESYHGLKHPLANARWVAKVMLECYKAHPKYKPRDFMAEVKKNHKVEISYYTAWHAYHLCNEKLLGSYEEGYSLLPALCDQILKENPRNIASLRTDPSNDRFHSLCIAYRASIKGFLESGRPFLGLDGCHLLGKYGGTLLAIMSLDGNNGLYPIAIYICQSECKETWTHFLGIMAAELKQHKRALTFISDRQKGLIEGVSSNFGDVNHQHRYCFRHLYKNFKKSHPGKNLEFIAWRAARSFSEVGHQIWMDRLKEAKESAPGWFDREAAATWSRCYFDRSSKCEHVTSNLCEAFNSWILDLRRLHIVKLLVPAMHGKYVEYHVCMLSVQVCVAEQQTITSKYVHPYMSVDNYRKLYAPCIGPLYDKALWPK
ncbi:hypothetical protein MKW94_010024, partial [Papaver nudicaule]|nr:hypothetical protein [Papaver nudicaule]